jgi:hypothetical protein
MQQLTPNSCSRSTFIIVDESAQRPLAGPGDPLLVPAAIELDHAAGMRLP